MPTVRSSWCISWLPHPPRAGAGCVSTVWTPSAGPPLCERVRFLFGGRYVIRRIRKEAHSSSFSEVTFHKTIYEYNNETGSTDSDNDEEEDTDDLLDIVL